MSYKRKTKDEWQLLINYGYGHGWECETTSETYAEIKQTAKEYRENCNYPVKIQCKRVPLEEQTA